MIEEALYHIAKATSGVTDLIGAGDAIKFVPEAEETEHAPPCVTFRSGDRRPIQGIWNDTGWFHSEFTFFCWGATAKAAKELAFAVRAAFRRYHSNGAAVGSTAHKIEDIETLDGVDGGYDPDRAAYWEEFTLEVFHN